VPVPTGRFLALSQNPHELDRRLTMRHHGHVLGLGLDVRADDAVFAKALLSDPHWRPRLLSLLSAHPAAGASLFVEPAGLVLRVQGEGVLPFSDDYLAEVRDLLFELATHLKHRPGAAIGPGEDQLRLHPPGGPGVLRYFLSCGCMSIFGLAWLGWVASIVLPLVLPH
jgi:hypothetical protein